MNHTIKEHKIAGMPNGISEMILKRAQITVITITIIK